jgi:hypothetical protein
VDYQREGILYRLTVGADAGGAGRVAADLVAKLLVRFCLDSFPHFSRVIAKQALAGSLFCIGLVDAMLLSSRVMACR